MKTFLTTVSIAVCSLSLSMGGMAADLPARAPAAPATPAASSGEVKSIPMYSRADVIDTNARIIITKRKDGKEVKNVLTPNTEIRQGQGPARIEDIKVGDYVSGSRKKVSETEYTVVKITKFGPKTDKPKATDKPAEKPAEPKSN